MKGILTMHIGENSLTRQCQLTDVRDPSTRAAALAQDDKQETQGPSTSLRSGRDNKGMADLAAARARKMNTDQLTFLPPKSCHPCHTS